MDAAGSDTRVRGDFAESQHNFAEANVLLECVFLWLALVVVVILVAVVEIDSEVQLNI